MDRSVIRRRSNRGLGRRNGTVLLGSILVLLIGIQTALGQETRPAAREAGLAPLSRHLPQRDLLAYLEFDGFDAHADAWRASAIYKLLNETHLGSVLEDLALQGIELLDETTPLDERVTGADVVGVVKHIAQHGFAVALFRKGPERVCFAAVVRRGDQPELKRLLGTLKETVLDTDREKKPDISISSRVGHKFSRLGVDGIWRAEKGDLVLSSEASVDELAAVQSGREQSIVDHPLGVELRRATDGFKPAAIGFVDMASLAPLTPDAMDLGLDGLERITVQWGFEGAAMVTRVRLTAPVPRRGALALLDQPAFNLDTLPALPPDLTSLFVLSVDLAKSYDQIDILMKRLDPPSSLDPPSAGILSRHGIDLRKELLEHLGPQIVFCSQASTSGETATAASLLTSRVGGFTLGAQVREEPPVLRSLDSLIKSFNPILREYLRGTPRNRAAPSLAFLKFQKLAGPHPMYVLDLPAGTLPPPYLAMLRPTVAISHDQLVVSASTPAAQKALSAGVRWRPTGPFLPVVNKLPADMIYLGLSDPRAGTAIFTMALPILVRQLNSELALAQRRLGKAPKDVYIRLDPDEIPAAAELDRLLFPAVTALSVDRQGAILTHRAPIPTLTSPAAATVAAAFLVPMLRESHETARRERCANNLKQIAQAMHGHHASINTFPRPAILSDKGEPLLSWRVAILPFIEQQELYDKFKRDERWDSPHNKALLKEMPGVYRCPIRTKPEPFTTSYRLLVGKGALFENDKDIGVADVTDGSANTLLIVESAEAVPWTKPDELPFNPAAPPSLNGAGSPHPGGFNAAMANGAVHFLKNAIDLNTFRALITRAGGEVIAPGAF
jgi:Protein of unknown function (DUF1559)